MWWQSLKFGGDKMPKIRHYEGLPIELIAHVDLTDMPDTTGINSNHDARYYTQAQLNSTVVPSGASLIGVSDAGAYFATTNIEAVLQEIMAVILPGAYLRLDGTNIPTANYNWTTNLSTTGNIYIDSDVSILGFGADSPATPDATIGFDGNSLNIIANAVTGTDMLDVTGDTIFNDEVQIGNATTDNHGMNTAPVASQMFTTSFTEATANTSANAFDITFVHSGDVNVGRTANAIEIDFDISGIDDTAIGGKNSRGVYVIVDDATSADSDNAIHLTYGVYTDVTWAGTMNTNTHVDMVGVYGNANGNMGFNVNAEHYGGQFIASGTANLNIGGYFSAAGATNNYDVYLVGTRNIYASGGDMTITASGGDILFGDDNIHNSADSSKHYFGVADDAYIEFDGNSMNIVANAVTATDDLVFSCDKFEHSAGLFDLNDDNVTTTGEITANVFDMPVTANATTGVINQNNVRFIHTYGTRNIFIGANAGNFTTAGTGENVALGEIALDALTTGYRNLSIGYGSMTSCTTGYENVAIGGGALDSCIGGYRNFALGYGALQALTNGSSNVAIGDHALGNGAVAGSNIAIGRNANLSNAGGAGNTCIGPYSLDLATTGSYNVAIGLHSMGRCGADPDWNVCIGPYAGYTLTGNRNTMIGTHAGRYDSGNDKLYIGRGYQVYSCIPLIYGEFANHKLRTYGDFDLLSPNELGPETLSETDFATHAKWDTTGDFDDTGGNATYIHNTGAGTLTQTAANLATAGVGNRWYVFQYTISGYTNGSITAHTITATFANGAITLPIDANGTWKFPFYSTAAPTDFVISITSNGACDFTIDNVSLKEMKGAILCGDATPIGFDQAGNTFIGDGGTTNYINIASNGDITFVGTSGFYPRRLNQSAIPVAGVGATQIDTGELLVWRDSDDGKIYMVYNDTTSGIKSVEMI